MGMQPGDIGWGVNVTEYGINADLTGAVKTEVTFRNRDTKITRTEDANCVNPESGLVFINIPKDMGLIEALEFQITITFADESQLRLNAVQCK